MTPKTQQALAELERLATLVAQRYGTVSDLWSDFGLAITAARSALSAPSAPPVEAKFSIGDKVRKIKGSQWRGTVVGSYSTELTPEGYAVESSSERGSVQIYPAAALELDGASAPVQEGREPVASDPLWTRHGSGEFEWWSLGPFACRKDAGQWVLSSGGLPLSRHEFLQDAMAAAGEQP